jgi:hypothetical protein
MLETIAFSVLIKILINAKKGGTGTLKHNLERVCAGFKCMLNFYHIIYCIGYNISQYTTLSANVFCLKSKNQASYIKRALLNKLKCK